MLRKRTKFQKKNVKKLEMENSMLKKELSTLKQEKECLNVKPFVCDASCDTNDLSDYGIEKCDFVEVESVYEKCKNKIDKKFANFICYNNLIVLV